MSYFDEFMRDNFPHAKKCGANEWKDHCPNAAAHNNNDKNESLNLSEGRDGCVVMHCKVCGNAENIVPALGLTMKDLFPPKDKDIEANKKSAPAADAKPKKNFYKYKDLKAVIENYKSYYGLEFICKYEYGNGAVKLRFWDPEKEDKTFFWAYPLKDGTWISASGAKSAWPELNPDVKNKVNVLYASGPADAETVWCVEGEKDADTINRLLDMTAMSTDGGAGTWKKAFTDQLAGKTVYIISDNDEGGRGYMETIIKNIRGRAKGFHTIDIANVWPDAPEKGDVTDMAEALGDDQTVAILKQAMDTTEDDPERMGFPEESKVLDFGKYSVTNKGVFKKIVRKNGDGDLETVNEIIFAHPVIPMRMFIDIESGETKYHIWYRLRQGDIEGNKVVDGDMLFVANKLMELAKFGVGVSSTRARAQVDYFRDMIDGNMDNIPIERSVSHLGWVKDNKFVPYEKDVYAGGDERFSGTLACINCKGDGKVWRAEAMKCRKFSMETRIAMSAGLASVLIEPLGLLPFFVHIWGSTSGSGKTVALMLSASQWGNPVVGNGLARSFSATNVSVEVMANYFRSIPVYLDELQLTKDRNGQTSFDVYKLAEGAGKSRSNTKLGLSPAMKWRLSFITTGETPMTKSDSAAGEHNRVIEIECAPGRKIIEDGFHTSNVLTDNYGWAGPVFIKYLQGFGDDLIPMLREKYSEAFKELTDMGVTEKQAMAGALIMIADALSNECVYTDEKVLDAQTMVRYLKSDTDIDTYGRFYDRLMDYLAGHACDIVDENRDADVRSNRPVIGIKRKYREGSPHYLDIRKEAFRDICVDLGCDDGAAVQWLNHEGKAIPEKGRHSDMRVWFLGERIHCIRLVLPENEEEEDPMETDPDGWTPTVIKGGL